MSMVDRGPPREQTANDAICVHVSTTRTRGIRCGGVAVCACVECARGTSTNHLFLMALPQNKNNEWNKWHFNEMKGEVGMSGHEKERQQEVAYTKTESNS